MRVQRADASVVDTTVKYFSEVGTLKTPFALSVIDGVVPAQEKNLAFIITGVRLHQRTSAIAP